MLDFDNSYLSRNALSRGLDEGRCRGGGSGGDVGGGGGRIAYDKSIQYLDSHTTAGVTTLAELDHEQDLARMMRKAALPSGGDASGGAVEYLSPATYSRASSSHFYDDSDFSDEDSLGSVNSADSVGTAASKYASIRYANSTAGQIWGILRSLDDLVLHVKVSFLDSLSCPSWSDFLDMEFYAVTASFYGIV